jgi:hypothetical protein
MRALIISSSLLVFVGASVAGHAAPNDAYCKRFASSMSPDTLYIANCTGDASCLQPVQASGQLQSKKPYRFLYSTGATGIKNSMVVVQLKHVGSSPQQKPADVQLARDALNFACVGFRKNVYRQSWPGNVDSEEALPALPYDKYDQYHRRGYTSRSEAQYLHDDFHTNYFDGDACVSTLEPVRRGQFLLFARRDVSDRTSSLINRFGGSVGESVADDTVVKRYERFKIILTNYQKESQASGCFSFSARGDGAELEVSLADLEEKAKYGTIFDRHTLKTWNFQLK